LLLGESRKQHQRKNRIGKTQNKVNSNMQKTAFNLLILSTAFAISSCSSSERYKQPNVKFTLQESQLPTYEKNIDHRQLISDIEKEEGSMHRGEQIYGTICFNCHGDPGQNGSIPTAFKFWKDTFKVGNDPYSIYQTLTKGYGSMPPQPMLTPREKYDVIHFIRNKFVAEHNKGQYFKIDSAYLDGLPKGDSTGPKPKKYEPWAEMDYGNFLINTYELVGLNPPPRERSGGEAPLPDEHLEGKNFAYKGIAIRLDKGNGGVAAGKEWVIFDHDVMRVAGAWTGNEFIDWEAILFNGSHNISPRTVGDLQFENPVGPGWADPETGSFKDDRFLARDGRRFGPLSRKWTHYTGLYQHNDRVVISYSVGNANVLETFGSEKLNSQFVLVRTLNITPSSRKLKMRIAPDSTSVALVGTGAKLKISEGFNIIEIPPLTAVKIKLLISRVTKEELKAYARRSAHPESLDALTKGGKARYPEKLTTIITRGDQPGPFKVDILTPPFNSVWKNQLRLSGIDFTADRNKGVVCSTDGDVWLVSGLAKDSGTLSWQRIASGLFQPLGIKVINEEIFVTCRDQIVKLRDFNGDGETDFYESFNSDHQVTDHFHEFAMGLQADKEGNLYYAKSARHAREALVPQHGTLIKVSKDGLKTDIIATGFRAANGVCINPDGSFIVTDQEGHWNPMNRINWVQKGRFYGNMFGYKPPADSSSEAMEQPLVWVERHLDQSPSELLWVDSKRWGALNGSLLNFSYGYGKVFIVPHEKVGNQMQGGIFELPIPAFSTGVMRGRFNPYDGQLYACGLSAWGSTQTLQLGGLFRIRYNGVPVMVPISLKAKRDGMQITFAKKLDPVSVKDIANYRIQTWDLLRSRKYGSDHYNAKELKVSKAELSKDRKTLNLYISEIKPTWVMEIGYQLKDIDGEKVEGLIQNTIYDLGSDPIK
jgi:mono/diheme cytochrome c family protein